MEKPTSSPILWRMQIPLHCWIMEMKLVDCGMRGSAIWTSNTCRNYRIILWLKASWSSKLPLEFAMAVLLESTLSISSIGGRKAENHGSWDWYILISMVPCLSHPLMDQGTLWISLMTFRDTPGSFFIKKKSEVLETFIELKALIENASGNKIKILRSDNGEVYLSNYFLHICSQIGIQI